MKTIELFCICKDWKESNNQIIDAQLIADNHGFKYTGKVFKYCPWCGNKLYTKENEYKNVYLFIEPDKHSNNDDVFRYYPVSFLLESPNDFTDLIKKKYPSRHFTTISTLKIGCSGVYKCDIVVSYDCLSVYNFYITEIKPITIRNLEKCV